MSKGSGGSFFAFFFGMITGGLLGLLFAPEKGSGTRNKLTFLLDKYRIKLEDIMGELTGSGDKEHNEAKSEGERIIKDARVKAEELLDDVNGLIDKIKKK